MWAGTNPKRKFRAEVWLEHDYFVATYRTRRDAIFRPITISGLPAVIQQSMPGITSCTITVGVAPGQALETFTDIDEVREYRPVADPCAAGIPVIEAMVSTLPPR